MSARRACNHRTLAPERTVLFRGPQVEADMTASPRRTALDRPSPAGTARWWYFTPTPVTAPLAEVSPRALPTAPTLPALEPLIRRLEAARTFTHDELNPLVWVTPKCRSGGAATPASTGVTRQPLRRTESAVGAFGAVADRRCRP